MHGALEKQVKLSWSFTTEKAAESEMFLCLGAANPFCTDQSFKTSRRVQSNFSKFREVTGNVYNNNIK